ncbi:MAG: alpha/beta hydrolase [Granulosicoccus sp.]
MSEVTDYLVETQLPQRSAKAASFNAPFELKAAKDAKYLGRFMLIHGLNDSPAVWHDWAEVLSQRGFDVRAILLPGHGNTPEAQLDVNYRDWLETARQHLRLWRANDTPFYVGGFSLGSVIATILALEEDGIDGMLLFSPAYKSSQNHLLRWASLVSSFKPWVFGGMIIEDNPAKYNSIPINAAAQYYKTTRLLRRRLASRKGRTTLDIPVLMVASLDDSVVDILRLRSIFQQHFRHPDKQLILYGNAAEAAQGGETFRNGAFPADRMLNQSHMSVLISPENQHYGRLGSQLVCNGNEWPVFSSCLYYKGNDRWRGAEGTPSPDDVPIARTTFNPDFSYVVELFETVFITPRASGS